MKCGRRQWSDGFTIVETLMFLAVTSALLASALTLVSGAQNKTEFSQAVNEFNQQINLVMNNVANGYYDNKDNFAGTNTCALDGSGLITFSSVASGQGTNSDCVFIGRALQFATGSEYYIYNLVAKRVKTDPATLEKIDVQTFEEAKIRVIDDLSVTGHTDWPETTEIAKIKNGLTVAKVQYLNAGATESTGGVAFYGGLAGYSAGNLSNGARQVDFSHIPGTAIAPPTPTAQKAFVEELEAYSDSSGGVGSYTITSGLDAKKNPASGVWICLDSGGTNQHATILIGGTGSQNSTKLNIKDGKCSSDNIL